MFTVFLYIFLLCSMSINEAVLCRAILQCMEDNSMTIKITYQVGLLLLGNLLFSLPIINRTHVLSNFSSFKPNINSLCSFHSCWFE
uniref:Secreted protein n=1 Tax=Anopheles darlingi TaxID=43151 RepID=A0A2M4DCS7_ANODA